jgi:hypothetical protein
MRSIVGSGYIFKHVRKGRRFKSFVEIIALHYRNNYSCLCPRVCRGWGRAVPPAPLICVLQSDGIGSWRRGATRKTPW